MCVDGILWRHLSSQTKQHGNATWSEMAMPSRRATQSNIDKHEIGSKRLYTCHRFNMVQYDSIAQQDPCDSGMGSEEGMELRDVLLLNLRLAGRRKSAPASAKHEDHILNEPLRFPWCSQCFVSKYPGTTAEELNVCLRVYTCVCVCDVLECALSVKLFLFPSLLQLLPLARCVKFGGSVHNSAATPALWNLFKQSPCCQGWHPRRVEIRQGRVLCCEHMQTMLRWIIWAPCEGCGPRNQRGGHHEC